MRAEGGPCRRHGRIERTAVQPAPPDTQGATAFGWRCLLPGIARSAEAPGDGGTHVRHSSAPAFGNLGSGGTHMVCATVDGQARKIHDALFTVLIQHPLANKRNLAIAGALKKLLRRETTASDDSDRPQVHHSVIVEPNTVNCRMAAAHKARKAIGSQPEPTKEEKPRNHRDDHADGTGKNAYPFRARARVSRACLPPVSNRHS